MERYKTVWKAKESKGKGTGIKGGTTLHIEKVLLDGTLVCRLPKK